MVGILVGIKRKLSSLAHMLYGVLTVFAPMHIAVIMFVAFLAYELDEQLHIKDKAYKDIAEFIIGLVIGVIIFIGLKSIF